ncbi:hypothetical protein GCM10023081_11160 [Arthrobacter ginkgonis]|uniref:DUF6318 domain-containing protein n=1 Tax=Arthrobacter ginkgonis TaxID=1630594 RepID=A0ABP7BZK4_9MICC
MVPATPTSPAKNVPVPELPEAAKEKTPEGAVAFTEFYVELVNYTRTTNSTDQILKRVVETCQTCFEGTINQSEYRREHGLHVVGGGFEIEVLKADIDGKYGTVLAESRLLEFKSYDEDGAWAETSPATDKYLTTFTLQDDGGGWKVLSVESAEM